METKEWIAQTVRKLRGEMTLRDVADLTGLSVSYLSDIERGRTIPTIETLETVFKACGATLTLGYTRDNPTPEYVEVKLSTLRQALSLLEDIAR